MATVHAFGTVSTGEIDLLREVGFSDSNDTEIAEPHFALLAAPQHAEAALDEAKRQARESWLYEQEETTGLDPFVWQTGPWGQNGDGSRRTRTHVAMVGARLGAVVVEAVAEIWEPKAS